MRGRRDRWTRKRGKDPRKGKRQRSQERNTRRRVRKSECHCRNLRTLTSFWLVPPSSCSQTPSTRRKPSPPPAPSFSLSSPSHLRVPPRDSSTCLSLPPSRPFAFPSLPLSPSRARFAPSLAPLAAVFLFNRASLRRLVSLKYFRNDSRVNVSPLLELEFFFSPFFPLPLLFFFFLNNKHRIIGKKIG